MTIHHKSFLKSAAAFAAVLLFAGCAFAPVMPPRGILFTDQKAPLFSGKTEGTLEGRSSAQSILLLAGWGDASLRAAMDDGGIKEVRHTDYRIQNYALIYQRFTTIAYGEAEITMGKPDKAESEGEKE